MVKRVKFLVIIFLFLSINLFAQNPNREANAARRAARLAAQPKAEVTRGPYLQAVTSNSIVIRWRTDTWTRSRVRYGTTPGNLNFMADDSSLVTEHEVKLTGLLQRTRYFYSIGTLRDTLEIGNDNYFVTLPLSGTEGLYRIGVFGDCGNGSQNQKDVRDAFIKYLGNDYMDSWILLGDNAYQNGSDLQYQTKFFDIYKDNLLKKYPLFPAPGNHEYYDIEASPAYAQRTADIPYFQMFNMPVNGEAGGVPSNNKAYYSFDIGNIHFLSLDSYGMEEQSLRLYDTLSPQVKWIRKDLEANKNKGWIVAYWHHPPYTMGSHNSDREVELVKIRENFIRILERYGVDLILCGHSHAYERSRLMNGYFGAEATFDSSKYNVASFIGKYKWNNSKENTRSIVITPTVGKSTFVVKDEYSCIEDRFEVIVSR